MAAVLFKVFGTSPFVIAVINDAGSKGSVTKMVTCAFNPHDIHPHVQVLTKGAWRMVKLCSECDLLIILNRKPTLDKVVGKITAVVQKPARKKKRRR